MAISNDDYVDTQLIHIPEDIQGVKSLLRARKWEKAAIVWAYVHAFDNGGDRKSISAKTSTDFSKPYTPESFAALGVSGLRSKDTVRLYWQRWQDAIDSGHASRVTPGDTFIEPALDWPPTAHSHGLADDVAAGSDDSTKAAAAVRILSAVDAPIAAAAVRQYVVDSAPESVVDELDSGLVERWENDEAGRKAARRKRESDNEIISEPKQYKLRTELRYAEKALRHVLDGFNPIVDNVVTVTDGVDNAVEKIEELRVMLNAIERELTYITEGH